MAWFRSWAWLELALWWVDDRCWAKPPFVCPAFHNDRSKCSPQEARGRLWSFDACGQYSTVTVRCTRQLWLVTCRVNGYDGCVMSVKAQCRFLRTLCLAFLFLGCSATENVIVCKHGVDPVTQKCAGPAGTDVGVPLDGNQDGGVPPDVNVSEDTSNPVPQCTLGIDPMNRKIGEPCSSHGDCETCLCYDEGYLSPFRFCTQNCESGLGSSCPSGTGRFDEYTCLRFAQKNITDHDLNIEAICMPVCQDAGDCGVYAPNYNTCSSFDTKWDGKTIAGQSTCQIQ